jgi:hypothetical protein
MLDAIVDTPVRGVVYEAAGSVDPASLAGGAALVRRVADTHRIPVELIVSDPADHAGWLQAAVGAVEAVLSR